MSIQGDKGAKGDKGERGRRGEGMSPGTRRAIVVLFAIAVALSVTAYLASVHTNQTNQANQRRQEAQQAAAQRAQAELIEAKLCTTLKPLAGLAGLRPPAGNPADNPARAFEQHLVAKLAPLAQLGPDLGCGKAARP